MICCDRLLWVDFCRFAAMQRYGGCGSEKDIQPGVTAAQRRMSLSGQKGHSSNVSLSGI